MHCHPSVHLVPTVDSKMDNHATLNLSGQLPMPGVTGSTMRSKGQGHWGINREGNISCQPLVPQPFANQRLNFALHYVTVYCLTYGLLS